MRTAARALALATMLASLSSVASAYYHWTYFVGRTGPFVPIFAKFDLSVLPNKRVTYFISDQPPSTLVANDNYDSLISQIRRAADTWNHVATSQLRFDFGGISTVGTPQATAGIDVVFNDDMPPGLLAQTSVSTPSDVSYLAGSDPATASVPILRSRVQLRSDLTARQQASFSDAFFMTIVHEFGHSIGLQHSQTSATMSTSLTRATTKALPLSADDRAAISLLYPTPNFAPSTGSISGQVQVGGQGVSLASVVALSTNGIAIGGMTNPDGTYRIDGIPLGDYYVYAHPLPPPQAGEALPAGLVAPLDPNAKPFGIDTSFDTQFFPGTHQIAAATQVTVTGAASVAGVDFSLQSRPNGSPMYDMQLFGFLDAASTVPVHAPPLVIGDRRFLVFAAPGLLVPNTNTLTRGLTVNVIGSAAQFEAATLSSDTNGFLKIVVDTNAVTAPTPVAVTVTTPTDLYVLPAAFSVVPSQPPLLFSVTGSTDAQGNSTATIAGSNLGTGMQFLFDGSPASGITVNSDATITMTAPPATGSHTAFVEVLASDGQTSSQSLGSALPQTFTYAAPNNPFLAVTPTNLIAGTDAMVEVTGFNTNFLDDETSVGFGSSDIIVRRTWVTDSTHILMNVSVSPAAALAPATLTVATGMQMATLNAAVQVVPPSANQISLRAPVFDFQTNLPGVAAGGVAAIDTTGLPANLRGWVVSISGVNTGWAYDTGNHRIYAFVLGALPPGPAVLRVAPPAGIDPIPPIVIQIDAPPPAILTAVGPDGTPLDDYHVVRVGDLITLNIARLGTSPTASVRASQVVVTVGGIQQTPTSITAPDQNHISQIQFALSSGFADGSQAVIQIQVFSRLSQPYRITLAPPPASQ